VPETQGMTSSLHIVTKRGVLTEKRYRPQEDLFSTIEQRAEAISGEFNSQGVPNTLWTYAVTQWGGSRGSG
jgi:hypothetical protein